METQLQSNLQRGNSSSVQNFLWSLPYHTGFGFLIPLLIAVLQVSVQGSDKSSFRTHPSNMYAFLLATFVYCTVFASHIKCKLNHITTSHHTSYCQFLGPVAFITGSLSSVSLISVLLPRLLGDIIFIPWSFVPALIAYQHATLIKDSYYSNIHPKIKDICDWLHQKMKETYDWLHSKIKDVYNWIYSKIKGICNWVYQKIKGIHDRLHQNGDLVSVEETKTESYV